MLKPFRLGFSGGIIWGLSMLICTVLSITINYSTRFLSLMADIYPGYSISWKGALIGFGYGFLDAFIGLFLLAWLYNKLGK